MSFTMMVSASVLSLLPSTRFRVRKDAGVQVPLPTTSDLRGSNSRARSFSQKDVRVRLAGQLRYDAGMLATFSDWMLGLPSILQMLVAFAVLMAIGLAPLVLWLGYAVATTRDAMQADRDRARP
jgi:hypothetical protein